MWVSRLDKNVLKRAVFGCGSLRQKYVDGDKSADTPLHRMLFTWRNWMSGFKHDSRQRLLARGNGIEKLSAVFRLTSKVRNDKTPYTFSSDLEEFF